MDETTTPTVQEDAARFYSELQAAGESGRDDAARLLPAADAQVETHRELVAALRTLLERAENELDHWAVAAANLRAAADPTIEPPGEDLGGKALVEVAVRVLADSDKPQPIHYRDWLQLVRLAGYRVGGVDPQASFLTAISRDERVESIGGRTGLWKLAE